MLTNSIKEIDAPELATWVKEKHPNLRVIDVRGMNEIALNKLKVPQLEVETGMMPLAIWWNNLQQRQQYRHLVWLCEGDLEGKEIPFTLFDSIAENLIENARSKRLAEPDLIVEISLKSHPLTFSVCDNGSAITEELASKLLHTVVDSENGLGVGLFQAARWAERLGYQVKINENCAGRVCFELLVIAK